MPLRSKDKKKGSGDKQRRGGERRREGAGGGDLATLLGMGGVPGEWLFTQRSFGLPPSAWYDLMG